MTTFSDFFWVGALPAATGLGFSPFRLIMIFASFQVIPFTSGTLTRLRLYLPYTLTLTSVPMGICLPAAGSVFLTFNDRFSLGAGPAAVSFAFKPLVFSQTLASLTVLPDRSVKVIFLTGPYIFTLTVCPLFRIVPGAGSWDWTLPTLSGEGAGLPPTGRTLNPSFSSFFLAWGKSCPVKSFTLTLVAASSWVFLYRP